MAVSDARRGYIVGELLCNWTPQTAYVVRAGSSPSARGQGLDAMILALAPPADSRGDRVHEAVFTALFICEGPTPGRPGEGAPPNGSSHCLGDNSARRPGHAWHRHCGTYRAGTVAGTPASCTLRHLTGLARTLPRGCRLDEVQADGSELHMLIAHAAEPTERPS
jgi:hypothetical protein